MATATATTSGLDLKVRRVRACVSQAQVADVMGAARQRIGYLEAVRRPPADAAARYLDALDSLTSQAEG